MQSSKGNDKLGTGCRVVSRAVGDSCPPTCDFLGIDCYAEGTERIYKASRAVGLRNMITEAGKIRSLILTTIEEKRSLRWHERGDLLKNGQLDLEYIGNIVKACESILADGISLPHMWMYSHVYDSRVVDMLGKHIVLYASIHNKEHKEQAIKAGYTLFAWCDTLKVYSPKKPRGKKAVEWKKALPKLAIIDGDKYVTCPEMRRGREAGGVTCTGTKDSIPCNLCVRGLANVLFLNH